MAVEGAEEGFGILIFSGGFCLGIVEVELVLDLLVTGATRERTEAGFAVLVVGKEEGALGFLLELEQVEGLMVMEGGGLGMFEDALDSSGEPDFSPVFPAASSVG